MNYLLVGFVNAKRECCSIYFAPIEARRFQWIEAWKGRDYLMVKHLGGFLVVTLNSGGGSEDGFVGRDRSSGSADWGLEELDCPVEAELWHNPSRLGR